MKSKILSISLILLGLLAPIGTCLASSNNLPSSFLQQAINKYRQKNYTGCIQDMDYIITKGKALDIAYYYKAISYARLGMTEEAKKSYEEAQRITNNQALKDYTTQAIGCIDDPSKCDANLDSQDITTFIKSGQFMHDDVQSKLQNKAVENAKSQINEGKVPENEDLKYLNMDNSQPTDKEIADAVRTFAKLGINPFGAGNNMQSFDSNLAQASAFFGNNNNNNNMMNLIPMISAMQSSPNGKNAMSKEFMQAFLMNQMLPGLDFGSNDK